MSLPIAFMICERQAARHTIVFRERNKSASFGRHSSDIGPNYFFVVTAFQEENRPIAAKGTQ